MISIRKMISFLLALCLMIAIVPVHAFAEEGTASSDDTAATIIASGTCGVGENWRNVKWKLDDAGVFTVSGTGYMEDYRLENYGYTVPWNGYVSKITSVVIEDGVVNIGDYSFCRCENLTSVTIADSVIDLGRRTFSACSKLTDITIPSDVTYIENGAFCGSGLVSVKIPYGVTGIDTMAFGSCTDLVSVEIPSSVTNIGTRAFWECNSLTSINLPDSITSIGEEAFSYCRALTNITLPDSITSLGANAFAGCGSLKTVAVPGSIGTLNDGTFSNSIELERVVIHEGVTSIGADPFYHCEKLTQISLPESLTSVGDRSCEYCYALTDVYYAGTEEQWNRIAFADYTYNLTNAVIHFSSVPEEPLCGTCGENLTWTLDSNGTLSISGSGAMTEWESSDDVPWHNQRDAIKSVVVGDAVALIGDYAFSACRALTSVTLPRHLTRIDTNAFLDCTALTDIYFGGTKAEWDAMLPNISSGNDPLLNAPRIHYAEGTGEPLLDEWAFSNHQDYFGESSEGYYISREDYDRLVTNLPENERELITIRTNRDTYERFRRYNIEDEHLTDYMGESPDYINWGGSCYGMSTWVCLVNNGVIRAADIDGTTQKLAAYALTENVESAINFYHFQQCISGRVNAGTVWENMSQTDQLKNLEELGKSANSGGDVFTISYQWFREIPTSDGNGEYGVSGHTVVGYGWEEIEPVQITIKNNTYTYDNRILIYDCAYPGQEYDVHLYYNDDGICCIPEWEFLSTDNQLEYDFGNNGELCFATSDERLMNFIDFNTGEVNVDVDLSSITAYADAAYDLECNGQTYRVNGVVVSGDSTENAPYVRVMSNITVAGTLTPAEAMTILPADVHNCTVISQDAMNLRFAAPGTLSNAYIGAPGRIRFGEEGMVSFSTEEKTDYSVTIVTDNGQNSLPWYMVQLEGEGASNISVENTSDGILISGDNLQNVSVCVSNGEERQQATLSSDVPAMLSERNGKPVFLIDKNGDGIFAEEQQQCADGHTYTDSQDTTCNVCGEEREVGIPSVPMFRMYDPNSGEHFYTGSVEEREILVDAGWHYEGVGFNFPIAGDPVHRLYDPVYGEHLYTMDEEEMNRLLDEGWQYENVAFNSAGTDEVPQYRLHNPNEKRGAYHFTGSTEERDHLISLGWEYQGIGWYSCIE